jgi:hypothetical protein
MALLLLTIPIPSLTAQPAHSPAGCQCAREQAGVNFGLGWPRGGQDELGKLIPRVNRFLDQFEALPDRVTEAAYWGAGTLAALAVVCVQLLLFALWVLFRRQ